jgi:hypothetical protein
MVAFKNTGAKLRDGVIPAGTTVWKKSRDSSIIELIVLEDGLIPTKLRKQIQFKTQQVSLQSDYCTTKYNNFRKCRVPKAYVVSITDCDGKLTYSAASYEDAYFIYKVGSIVVPDSFDSNPDEICTHGIHVFLSREEAVAYDLS